MEGEPFVADDDDEEMEDEVEEEEELEEAPLVGTKRPRRSSRITRRRRSSPSPDEGSSSEGEKDGDGEDNEEEEEDEDDTAQLAAASRLGSRRKGRQVNYCEDAYDEILFTENANKSKRKSRAKPQKAGTEWILLFV